MCGSGVALDGGAVVCGAPTFSPAVREDNSIAALGWSQQSLLQWFECISRSCLFYRVKSLTL